MGLLSSFFGSQDNCEGNEDKSVVYDENVNYDELEQNTYEDSEGYVFYACPKCGGKYLATFMMEEDGETMCIDCASKN